MEGESDRRAYFKMVLGYADEQGVVHTYINDVSKECGVIAPAVAVVSSDKAWSQIWNIYIPKWANGKTLSELSFEEIDRHEKKSDRSSEFYHFAQWLT